MKYRRKLFASGDIYNLPASDGVFIRAMKENVAFHMERCTEYRNMLAKFSFDVNSLNSVGDLHRIPPLPTSYLKNNTLLSKPYNKLVMKTSSSGTGGKKTLSGFDAGSGLCGLCMVFRVFRYHKLLSPKRTNYIILGYQPDKSMQTATAKALRWSTLLAPAKKTEYALKITGGEYRSNMDDLVEALTAYDKQNIPVRIVGFPAFL